MNVVTGRLSGRTGDCQVGQETVRSDRRARLVTRVRCVSPVHLSLARPCGLHSPGRSLASFLHAQINLFSNLLNEIFWNIYSIQVWMLNIPSDVTMYPSSLVRELETCTGRRGPARPVPPLCPQHSARPVDIISYFYRPRPGPARPVNVLDQ